MIPAVIQLSGWVCFKVLINRKKLEPQFPYVKAKWPSWPGCILTSGWRFEEGTRSRPHRISSWRGVLFKRTRLARFGCAKAPHGGALSGILLRHALEEACFAMPGNKSQFLRRPMSHRLAIGAGSLQLNPTRYKAG